MSDIRNQHGMLSWCELVTPDPAAAAEFYRKVYGWTSESMTMPDGNIYIVALNAEGSKVGGIMAPPAEMPPGVPPYWGIYITVDNVDAALEAATANGATILVPPFDVPGVGRMAHFKDSQGAAVAAITYETPIGEGSC